MDITNSSIFFFMYHLFVKIKEYKKVIKFINIGRQKRLNRCNHRFRLEHDRTNQT